MDKFPSGSELLRIAERANLMLIDDITRRTKVELDIFFERYGDEIREAAETGKTSYITGLQTFYNMKLATKMLLKKGFELRRNPGFFLELHWKPKKDATSQ